MTKEERQSIILELLIQHNSILVTDLATHLNVSSVTIRKDLTDLEREKKLYRNHGKAILIDPYIDNRNVSEKEKLYVEERSSCASKKPAQFFLSAFCKALGLVGNVSTDKICQKCEENSLRFFVYVLQYLCYRIMRLFWM